MIRTKYLRTLVASATAIVLALTAVGTADSTIAGTNAKKGRSN